MRFQAGQQETVRRQRAVRRRTLGDPHGTARVRRRRPSPAAAPTARRAAHEASPGRCGSLRKRVRPPRGRRKFGQERAVGLRGRLVAARDRTRIPVIARRRLRRADGHTDGVSSRIATIGDSRAARQAGVTTPPPTRRRRRRPWKRRRAAILHHGRPTPPQEPDGASNCDATDRHAVGRHLQATTDDERSAPRGYRRQGPCACRFRLRRCRTE